MAIGKTDSDIIQKDPRAGTRPPRKQSRPRPGVVDYMAGEQGDFVADLQPYLPQDLMGGAVPHIPGKEEEAVWNAAAQACGTEKVHFVYSVDSGRVWYLACPSASLASNPDSWCPLGAALPGNSEFWDKETVYLYEQEGLASALRWDPETGRLQVFLGAARTILPRIQTMDANFVTVNPEVADIIPWRNRNLQTEKLARAVARMLVISGVIVTLAGTLLLVFSYLAINFTQRNLDQIQKQTNDATSALMLKAYDASQSDTIKHMVRIQELLDNLAKVDGTLVRYEISKGQLEWQALVPPAFAQDFGSPMGMEKDGRVRVKNTH